jgi:hypothetical protein
MTSTSYQVGDPDPTAGPDPADCLATDGNYICTWSRDHDGPHIAGTGEIIAAVWDA